MAIGESLSSLFGEIGSRARSPLFGAFSITWVAFNYKFLLVFFSGEPLEQKFNLIDSLYPDTTSLLVKRLLYPLLIAALYILIYPWPARGASWYWHWMQRRQDDDALSIRDKGSLPSKEAQKLRHDLASARNEVAGLKNELEGLRESHSEQMIKLQRRDGGSILWSNLSNSIQFLIRIKDSNNRIQLNELKRKYPNEDISPLITKMSNEGTIRIFDEPDGNNREIAYISNTPDGFKRLERYGLHFDYDGPKQGKTKESARDIKIP